MITRSVLIGSLVAYFISFNLTGTYMYAFMRVHSYVATCQL